MAGAARHVGAAGGSRADPMRLGRTRAPTAQKLSRSMLKFAHFLDEIGMQLHAGRRSRVLAICKAGLNGGPHFYPRLFGGSVAA